MTHANRHFKWHHLLIGIAISIFLMILISIMNFYSDFNDNQIQIIAYFILISLSSIFCLLTKQFNGKNLKVIRQLGIIFLFISIYFVYLLFITFNA